MFIRDDFPEFCANLIAALTSLHVYDLTHGEVRFEEKV
jgi:hypothetical protein